MAAIITALADQVPGATAPEVSADLMAATPSVATVVMVVLLR